MSRLLIILLLISCGKEPVETRAVMCQLAGASLNYREIKVTEDAFCGRKLYSLSASNRESEKLLISVVCDSLVAGSYPAGLSYWGSFLFTDDITFNVIRYEGRRLTASFGGSRCSGVINY